MLDFELMFKSYNEATERKWSHNRNTTLGASETFGCIRKAWFSKRGEQPDDGYVQGKGHAKRGSVMENHYIVPVLQAGVGSQLLFAGDEQESIVDGYLSATPDGVITGLQRDALAKYGVEDIESDCIIVEIKTFDPQTNLKGPKEQHIGQVNQQFGLIRKKTELRPLWAVILYVNASDYSDIKPMPIRFDPSIFAAAEKRGKKVFEENDVSSLQPEGKIKGGSDCDYCAWTGACSKASSLAVPTERKGKFSKEDEIELERMIRRKAEIDTKTTSLKTELETLKEDIKQWLRDHNTGFAKTKSGFSASWQKVKGRESLDRGAMELDGIDLNKYTKVGEDSDRLVIKCK